MGCEVSDMKEVFLKGYLATHHESGGIGTKVCNINAVKSRQLADPFV